MFDDDDLAEIREGREEWESETLGPTLHRFGERRESFETDTGGQSVDRLYTPDDVSDLDYDDDLGYPGEDPYTRGVYSSMYRTRPWTIRQFAGFGPGRDQPALPRPRRRRPARSVRRVRHAHADGPRLRR